MLRKFAVTNYRGFSERIEWDLTQPKNYEFNSFAVKDGLVKNGIIYGPNGCGKSNFALAIFDIVNHLSQNWKKPDYYINFVFAGAKKQPVEFEYEFSFDDYILKYKYSKNAQGILTEEYLNVNSEEIFTRKLGSLIINDAHFPMDEHFKKNFTGNANNVSIINFLLTSYPLPEHHYLLKLRNFVNSMLWFRSLEDREFIGLETNPDLINRYIITHGLIKEFSIFLKNISGQEFEFSKIGNNNEVIFCNINGSFVDFNSIASTGTHSLTLLFFWLKHLEKASFVFIDEFDAFYHFDLAFKICKEIFKLDCQAFMSSHNTYLMTNDLLRPDCNFILDKNKIKPLCDCTEKELRWGHNIEKLFRGGTFQV